MKLLTKGKEYVGVLHPDGTESSIIILSIERMGNIEKVNFLLSDYAKTTAGKKQRHSIEVQNEAHNYQGGDVTTY